MSAMPTAPANGIEIAYETQGDPSDPTILLVMGLGSQLVSWPDEFCDLLVERGFHVVRFDNRDAGRSTWIDTPELEVGAAVMGAIGGDTSSAPYLLRDMAADAVGLLDHLGLGAVHLVGVSMGGMIAQTVAIEHPDRVRTLTSIMSTTGDPHVGQPDPDVLAKMLTPRPTDREAFLEQSMEMSRAIGGKRHFDEQAVRARAIRELDRASNPAGVARQLLAILASGSRAQGLAALSIPTLVIHGTEDTLVNVSGGERTAELVPGADLLLLDDMGHDLPEPFWVDIADRIAKLATAAGPTG